MPNKPEPHHTAPGRTAERGARLHGSLAPLIRDQNADCASPQHVAAYSTQSTTAWKKRPARRASPKYLALGKPGEYVESWLALPENWRIGAPTVYAVIRHRKLGKFGPILATEERLFQDNPGSIKSIPFDASVLEVEFILASDAFRRAERT